MNARASNSIDVIVPVFNGADTVGATLRRLLELIDVAAVDARVIVCDDGSSDATAERLAEITDPRLTSVRLARNGGRAKACNTAAARADAACLLLLDADCRPLNDDYIRILAEHAAAGSAIVYGPISGEADGFWSRYLQQVERRRQGQAQRGDHLMAMTTGNLMLRRRLFSEAGGFSELYRHYGFEDKDLLARLLELGAVPRYDERVAVVHRAGNTVAGYCGKMRAAARYTAPLFARRFPLAYRRMAYARLDPDGHSAPVATLLRALGRWTAEPATRVASWLVERSPLGWSIKSSVLKVAAALSFLRGAAERGQG